MLSQILSTPSASFRQSFLLPNDLSPTDSCDDLSDVNIPQYPRKAGKWTIEEDDLLRKYVDMHGEKQWRKISHHIPGRTSIQCLHRWSKILRPGLVKGPWTPEEDQKLIAWIKAEGPNKWAHAANVIIGRSGKQCRERWFNNLSPEVKKTEWTKEEDELIFELYQKHGSSWSKIAKFVAGRTENSIKNRFYSTLRKIAADRKKGNKIKAASIEGSNLGDDDQEEGAKNEEAQNPQVPHTLYKLLQESTIHEEEKEDEVEEEKTESPVVKQKNLISPKDKKLVETEISPPKAPVQASSMFNFNGEKLLIKKDGSIVKKFPDETQSSVNSPQENKRQLLFNFNIRNSEESRSAPKLDPRIMIGLMQQNASLHSNELRAVNGGLLPLLDSQKDILSQRLQILNNSNLALNKERLFFQQQEAGDLSNPIEINLAEGNEVNMPLHPSNGFKLAPLKFPPSTVLNNLQPLNFNMPSRYPSLAIQTSPLTLNRLTGACSAENSIGVPLMTRTRCFSDRSDSQPGSGLLQCLKSKKEMSQTSQTTQASIGEFNERYSDVNRTGNANELLLAMSKTINKASSMQQNCFKMLNGVPNVKPENELQMAVMMNQLRALDGLFSNVNGQLVNLEASLQERNLMNHNNLVNVPDIAALQGKRMLLDMLRQNPLNQRELEMGLLMKRMKYN